MSRVLIFGGDGLLGSHLYLTLRECQEVSLTLHGDASMYPANLFCGARVFDRVAAGDFERVAAVLDEFRPTWVLNAIGLSKRPLASDPFFSLEANTVFPHLLAKLCEERQIRLMHFSTDGVFSGGRGRYSEEDVPDARDWYGRCKQLGEPHGHHVLVLRTAFVGLELGCKQNLVEWFLSKAGCVPGYLRAIWSGFSAREVGRLVCSLVSRTEPLYGIWHVASAPISKYDFLVGLNQRLGLRGVEIVPDANFACDRSLDGTAFATLTGYVSPSWNEMLDELVIDIEQRWSSTQPSYWSV